MRMAALAGLSLVLAACGDDPPSGPDGATLRVSVTTQGTTRDADGYVLRVTGRSDTVLRDGVGLEFAPLPPGRYEVTLAGIARNCAPTSSPRRTLVLGAGDALTADFVVACDSAIVNAIIYRAFVDGRWQILALTPGDTTRRRIADGFDASVSPDGRRLAIVDAGLFVMNADGSDRRALSFTNGLGVSWSPDGSRIAFGEWMPGHARNLDIRVIAANGTSDTRLVGSPDPEYAPRWSPDGARLAFTREVPRGDSYQNDVFVVNADGTGERSLANEPSEGEDMCDWSLSDRVLFLSSFFDGRGPGLFSVAPEGAALELLRQEAQIQCGVWSPDGRAVAVRTSFGYLYLLDSQGQLLQEPAVVLEASGLLQWVP
jgi:Tol biopolymer transport system component